jgi:hypothetical protein
MRRVVYVMQVAFWTSVPLLAVSLAVSWLLDDLVWPAKVLWAVVVVSSAFLTAREYRLMPKEGGESPAEARRRLETLVYPVVLVLACSLPAFQVLPFRLPF